KFPRWISVAIVIAIAATAIQLLPLPPALLRVFSPAAFEIRQITSETGPAWWPLSLAPAATVLALVKLISAALAFLLAVNFLYKPVRIRVFLLSFVGAGVVLAMVGLAQRALDANKILGIYSPDWWHGFMATFVDANHAAGFFLLVFGVGIGLALHSRRRTAM